ncbi:hypothetical protein [Methylovulum psychrotolerans]|uniref:Uncharacterized protein n=1 Tax=Methylovulum psychrotolerans TaxID=1704499 RepID=A0A2S5CIL3_9GAMM|nr:hypothetical protein [Methylovulum psychrotolerans]POZ50653.1 hypothetical protein AADEFJLK_03550 [Methylovulum psychrotolerans]
MNKTLTVFAVSESALETYCVVRVYWMTGKQRKKAVDVRLALTCENKLAAAEAVAIRYLLGEACVFNKNCTGHNLRIVVAKGAIKKLGHSKSRLEELYDYGYPLLNRYMGANIIVSKDNSWFPSVEQLGIVPCVDGEKLRGRETFETNDKGVISITRHALERYQENCGTVNPQTTWKSLIQRLQFNAGIEKVELPKNVLEHKIGKYGEPPEVWRHPDSTLHFVFCIKHDCKVLVTVFDRNTKFDKAFHSPKEAWAVQPKKIMM